MVWKKGSLKSCKLYLILDRDVADYDRLLVVAKEALAGGVDIIQLRDKKGHAKDILDFSSQLRKVLQNKIPFIINDRADLAVLSGASGVHVGQDDLSTKQARKFLSAGKLVGVSCQTLEQAVAAEKAGADYIGFGSVYKTQTKPERNPMELNILQQVFQRIRIPVFAIGGIDLKNVVELTTLNINRVAVCRAICESKEVRVTTREIKKLLALSG